MASRYKILHLHRYYRIRRTELARVHAGFVGGYFLQRFALVVLDIDDSNARGRALHWKNTSVAKRLPWLRNQTAGRGWIGGPARIL